MDDPQQQGPHGPEAPPPGFDEVRRALHDVLNGEAGGHSHGAGFDRQCVDLCPICRTADVLRATVPPEVQDHWYSFQREALLALRAFLDHYIDRVERERSQAVEVEDIPID